MISFRHLTLCVTVACLACDERTLAQKCDGDLDPGICLEAAREKLAAQERDLALYYFNRACEAGSTTACHERAVALRADTDPESQRMATDAFLAACDRNIAASCLEAGRAWRDGLGVPRDPLRAREALDRACRGGETTACAERDRIPPDTPPPAPPPLPPDPLAEGPDGRPWFYPPELPLLGGGAVHRTFETRFIAYSEPRGVITEQLVQLVSSAGWTPADSLVGDSSTLLAFTRGNRRVSLRIDDDGATACRLLVLSDLIQSGSAP